MLAGVGRMPEEGLQAGIPAACIIGCVIGVAAGLELPMHLADALFKVFAGDALERGGDRSDRIARDQAYVIIVTDQQRFAADYGLPFRARGRRRHVAAPSNEADDEGI